MNEEKFKKIENTFRNSTSPDELFDALQDALNEKLDDPEMFKILLGNSALSSDEIRMFTEKLIREYTASAYDLSMWIAQVFGNFSDDYQKLEYALNYYIKATIIQPGNFEPFLKILSLYNYDVDLPTNYKIVEAIESGIALVHLKSKIYYAFSDHYKKIGNLDLAAKYLALAEKATEKEGR